MLALAHNGADIKSRKRKLRVSHQHNPVQGQGRTEMPGPEVDDDDACGAQTLLHHSDVVYTSSRHGKLAGAPDPAVSAASLAGSAQPLRSSSTNGPIRRHEYAPDPPACTSDLVKRPEASFRLYPMALSHHVSMVLGPADVVS